MEAEIPKKPLFAPRGVLITKENNKPIKEEDDLIRKKIFEDTRLAGTYFVHPKYLKDIDIRLRK